jgi:hypothetical protein
MQPRRRPSEAAHIDDRRESLQLAKVHRATNNSSASIMESKMHWTYQCGTA